VKGHCFGKIADDKEDLSASSDIDKSFVERYISLFIYAALFKIRVTFKHEWSAFFLVFKEAPHGASFNVLKHASVFVDTLDRSRVLQFVSKK